MTESETSTWPGLEKPDTSNATYIGWMDSSDKRRYDPNARCPNDPLFRRCKTYYQHLDLMNNGYKHGNWWNKEFYTWLENERLIASCTSQLDLTRQERLSAKRYYHRLPKDKFGTYKEDVAVATCFYVMEQNKQDLRRGHPNTLTDEQFRDIETRFGVSETTFRNLYARIERRVRLGNLNKFKEFDGYHMVDHIIPESQIQE